MDFLSAAAFLQAVLKFKGSFIFIMSFLSHCELAATDIFLYRSDLFFEKLVFSINRCDFRNFYFGMFFNKPFKLSSLGSFYDKIRHFM